MSLQVGNKLNEQAIQDSDPKPTEQEKNSLGSEVFVLLGQKIPSKLLTHYKGFVCVQHMGRLWYYEGESNEKLKSSIKIRNAARLSCKLITVILMV